MEPAMFCPTKRALWWLIWKCEDDVSLTHLEEEWEGCPWIPVKILTDYMESSTLTKLIQFVGQFSLEDTLSMEKEPSPPKYQKRKITIQ